MTKEKDEKLKLVPTEPSIVSSRDSFGVLNLENTVSRLHLLAHQVTVASKKVDHPQNQKIDGQSSGNQGSPSDSESPFDNKGEKETVPSAKPPLKGLPSQKNKDPEKKFRTVSTFGLKEKLGEGGMGVVYRANQQVMNRDVAVKQMHTYLSRMEGLKEGFVNEALVTGRLAHPNIPPVYGLDTLADNPSMVMKLIGGCTLEEILHPKTEEHERLLDSYTFEKKIELLIAVCNPVRFAHANGIIHRDLKPANIMIGEFGEILVLDWGLACVVDPSNRGTIAEGISSNREVSGPEGTWSYAPPEMMNGVGDFLGFYTDEYLLGAILYEMINERPPHQERVYRKFQNQEQRDRIVPLDPDADEEIREICMKSLAPSPKDRYSSVREFQQALEIYLTHRSSRAVCDSAQKVMRSASLLTSDDPNEKERTALYEKLQEAAYGYKQALTLWGENEAAQSGHRDANLALASAALTYGDYGLAETQLKGFVGEDVERLLQQITEGRQKALSQQKARTSLKRIIVASAAVLVTAAISGVFVFRGMNSSAELTAAHVEQKLHEQGDDELQRITANAAREMAGRKDLIVLALTAFALDMEKHLDDDSSADFLDEEGSFSWFLPDGMDEDAARKTLQRLKGAAPAVEAIYALNKDLVTRYYVGFADTHLFVDYPPSPPKSKEFDPVQRPWFQRGVGAKNVQFTPAYVDVATKEMVMSAVVPIRSEDGTVIGVAGVDAKLNDILSYVEFPAQWSSHAKVEIARNNMETGKIEVVFKRESSSSAPNNQPTDGDAMETVSVADPAVLAQIEKNVQDGVTGSVSMVRDGLPVSIGYAAIPTTKSYLIITVEDRAMTKMATGIKSRIVSQIDDHLIEMAELVGLLFLIVILGIVLITRKIR